VQKVLSDLAHDPGSGKFKDVSQQRDDQQRQGESFGVDVGRANIGVNGWRLGADAIKGAGAMLGKTRLDHSFGLAPAIPSVARSYQALTFYPALTIGSMVIDSTGPILGLSASAIAAFLASSTVSKSPVYVASKAGGIPGARGLAK
jgi:hypothetical protein